MAVLPRSRSRSLHHTGRPGVVTMVSAMAGTAAVWAKVAVWAGVAREMAVVAAVGWLVAAVETARA